MIFVRIATAIFVIQKHRNVPKGWKFIAKQMMTSSGIGNVEKLEINEKHLSVQGRGFCYLVGK